MRKGGPSGGHRMHRRYDKPIREKGQITVGRRRMAAGQHGEPPEVSEHDCMLRPTRRLAPGSPAGADMEEQVESWL